MYFAKSERCPTQPIESQDDLGKFLSQPGSAHLVFDTVVSSLSARSNLAPDVVATALLKQPPEKRKEAVKKAIVDTSIQLGGNAAFLEFYQQTVRPHRVLRLESIGGIDDDIFTAMSRAELVATKAVYAKQIPGYTEREFVDFFKSTRRTLEKAIEDGDLDLGHGDIAYKLMEKAALASRSPNEKSLLTGLIKTAQDELHQDARERVLRQYAPKPKEPSPTPINGQGNDSPSPD